MYEEVGEQMALLAKVRPSPKLKISSADRQRFLFCGIGISVVQAMEDKDWHCPDRQIDQFSSQARVLTKGSIIG